MAGKKTFLDSMEPLEARMQLASLVSPRELQSLSASCQGLKSALYGNRDCLLRASLESHYRAGQLWLIDVLNAPKANQKDTYGARYADFVAANLFPAKPEIVTGYKKYCDDKNRAWRRQLVAEMPKRPYAALYAHAAVYALNLPPRAKSTWGWRASAMREQLADREAYEQLDWHSARRWLDGLEEDPEAKEAVRRLALTYGGCGGAAQTRVRAAEAAETAPRRRL